MYDLVVEAELEARRGGREVYPIHMYIQLERDR